MNPEDRKTPEEENTGVGTPGAEASEAAWDGAVSPAPDTPPPGEAGGDAGGEAEGEVEGEVNPEEELRLDFEALQLEMDRLRDQHLRLAADFENYRKRVSGELAGGWTRGQAELVKALLEGLDDLQRVSLFTSENANLDTLIEGVDLAERKLMKALTEAGLEVLDPEEGSAFDPNMMEAVMRVPAEEEGKDDTVHQVFQKGYTFKELLVRPARVSVFKDDD